jgi:superfamily II DNA or RNA helicase
MERREVLQRAGLNKWAKNNCKGILNWVTGMGKTYAAILAIEQFINLYPKDQILIVCPTTAVVENFQQEFVKFKKENLLKQCKFICYASIKKEDGNSYSLVILDEVHNICTDNKMSFFTEVITKGILGLSASLTDEQIRMLRYYLPIVDKLTMDDVGQEGFIADFTIINYPISFSPAESAEYRELTEQIDHSWQKFHRQSWKKIGQRSKLIYSAEQKLLAATQITELFENDYGIIFSLSKQFAEDVADTLGETCVAIHSGHSKKQRAQRLQLFADVNTKVRQLSVPKIYDEGVTLPLLVYGLMLSGHSKEKQMIQRTGRTLRTDIAGKHSILVRTYIQRTVEEKWVKSAQAGFNVINVEDFEALKKVIRRIQNK